jgi:hypothetical protein
MRNNLRIPITMLCVPCVLLLAGCPTTPVVEPTKPAETTAPSTPTPPPTATTSAPPQVTAETTRRPAELALAEGVDLYNEGKWAAAIRKLQGTAEIWTESNTIQIEALKYLAFSYCVTDRPSQCRQNFDRILALDPSFELTLAESGHPKWGNVFKQAKQASRGGAAPRPATR